MCLDVSSLVSSRGVIVGLDLSSVTNVSRKLRLVQNYRCCQFDENRFDARATRKVLASFLRFIDGNAEERGGEAQLYPGGTEGTSDKGVWVAGKWSRKRGREIFSREIEI